LDYKISVLNRQILAATRNRGKLREIRQILSDTGWEVLSLDDFPSYPEAIEDGATFLENALIKAREGFRRTNTLTLSDDSGLEVDYLDGRPGVYSARYAGVNAVSDDNIRLLLSELSDVSVERRTARFRCVMALVGQDSERWWEGVSEGVIINEKRGRSGFGYDPIFLSPELGQTFAEASSSDKNLVSHRGRALAALANILTDKA